MLEGEDYIAQIAQITHKQGISIDVCATSETSFSFSIHNADCNISLIKDLEQIGTISVGSGHNNVILLLHIPNNLQENQAETRSVLNLGPYTIEEPALKLLRNIHHCFLKGNLSDTLRP